MRAPVVAALFLALAGASTGCSSAHQRPIATLPAQAPTAGVTETSSATLKKAPRAPLTASAQPMARGRSPDRRVSERVRAALIADERLREVGLDRVRVVTTEGKVELSGLVTNEAESHAVEESVRTVKGVETVDTVPQREPRQVVTGNKRGPRQ